MKRWIDTIIWGAWNASKLIEAIAAITLLLGIFLIGGTILWKVQADAQSIFESDHEEEPVEEEPKPEVIGLWGLHSATYAIYMKGGKTYLQDKYGTEEIEKYYRPFPKKMDILEWTIYASIHRVGRPNNLYCIHKPTQKLYHFTGCEERPCDDYSKWDRWRRWIYPEHWAIRDDEI